MVTPDTCMDIIFRIDYTNNRINDSFCGIDDRTFRTHERNDEERLESTFAIRFYAWSAMAFCEESLRDTRNKFFDVGYHFSKLKKQLELFLFEVQNIEEMILITEQLLLQNISEHHQSRLALEAVAQILLKKGNLHSGQLAGELHISSRQLERTFMEYIGVSPKNLSSMVRYQYLWNDILYNPRLSMLDAVNKYGYTDQPHLARDFKKYHSMSITQANAHVS